MNVKYISGLQGINTLHSPRMVADNYCIDCRNVLFRDGTMTRRWGYSQIAPQLPTKEAVRAIIHFDQFSIDQRSLIAVTYNDIFAYNAADITWEYVTPIYTTGTVSASGSSVTGSGTSWSSVGIVSGDKIGFGTTNPNNITTWYTVATVNSNTSITLTEILGSSIPSGTLYVIRRLLKTGDIDWCIATKTDGTRYLIITTGDIPLYWNGSGYFNYITAANKAKYCGYFGSTSGEHLLLGDTIDTGVRQPNTIEMSDIGNPLSWNSGDYIDLYDTNDGIKGFKKIRDMIAVYKAHSISLLAPSFTSDIYNVRQNVVNDIGTVSIKTVGDFGNYHIFMSLNNVHVFDGANIKNIGDEIKNTLFSQLNYDYIHRAFAFTDTVNNLYMLFVPTGRSMNPDVCYVYDLYCEAWTRFEFAHTITAAGDVYMPYEISWEDMQNLYNQYGTHTWDWLKENSVSWLSLQGGAYYRMQMFGDSDGNIYRWDTSARNDNGLPIRAYIETKDYSLNEPYKLATVGDVRLYLAHQPIINNITPILRVRGSMNYGSEWSEEKTVDMVHPQGIRILDRTVSFALRGNYLRLKFANTNNGDMFTIEGIAVTFNDAGV